MSNRRFPLLPLLVCLLALLVPLVGCSEGDTVIAFPDGNGDGGDGGGDGGGVLDPPLSDIDGMWATTAVEVLDTCGFDPLPAYAPIMIEDNGAGVVFTSVDGFGNCQQTVRGRNGDSVTMASIDTFDGGCGIVQMQQNTVYQFDGDTLAGQITNSYQMVDGNCSNVPCTYQVAISGSRCDGCFPGCATVSDAPNPLLPGATTTAGGELAPR